jgi:hypothetical protein
VQVAPSTRAAVSSLRGRPGDEAGLRAAWAHRRIYAHGTFVGMAVQARQLNTLNHTLLHLCPRHLCRHGRAGETAVAP